MAVTTIRNLRITVSSDTTEAVSALDRLQRSLESLNRIAMTGLNLDSVSAGIGRFAAQTARIDLSPQIQQMRDLSDAMRTLMALNGQQIDLEGMRDALEQARQIQDQTQQIQQNTQNIRTETEKATKQTHLLRDAFTGTESTVVRLLTRIKNIALNRLIRSAILLFTKGIKEGFDNYINWSAEARQSMDQFSTSSMYLKNSIAAMLMPMLLELIPVFQQIVHWIAQATQAISMFWAYLNGNDTYVRAREDYFAAWGDDLDEANAKAKAFKATILGFDEIHALNDNSGSGSGSGKTLPNYNDMFEEAAVDMDVVNKMKEILRIVQLIVAALATIKVIKEITGLLNTLNSMGWLDKLGASVITIGVEFVLLKDSFKKIFSGTASTKDWIVAALTAGLGTAFLGAMWGPAGVVISVGVVLVAAVTGLLEQSQITFENSELGKKIAALKARAEETIEITKQINVNIDARTEGLKEIQGAYAIAIELIDKIYELAEEENKDSGDIARLKLLIDTVNGLGFGTLIGGFDNLTGSITDSKNAVTDLLNEIVKLNLQDYGASQLGAALTDKNKAEQNLEDAYGVAEDYIQQITSLLFENGFTAQQVADIFDVYSQSVDKSGESLGKLIAKASSSNGDLLNLADLSALKELTNGYDVALQGIKETQDTVAKATDEVDYYTQLAMGNFEVGMDETGSYILTVFNKIASGAKETAGGIETDFDNAVGNSENAFDLFAEKVVSFDGTTVTVDFNADTTDISDKLSEAWSSIQNFFIRATNESGSFWTNFWAGVQNKYDPAALTGMKDWQSYATGGFPEDGIFFANSGELVGGFSNGRTAVANNEQIVDGIASGVRQAMSEFSGGGDVTVQVFNSDGSLANETTVSAAERRNRRAGATVIPVGV